MTSEKFRHQLRKEAKLWQAEGLIDQQIYQQLANRYQFQGLDSAASDRFIMLLLGLGGILLGIGVITFVSANWQNLSQVARTVILLTLLIVVNTSGFYLWRQSTGDRPDKTQRLGHGLLIFGALLLGANIGQISQTFHIGGEAYNLFIIWGLGVIAMSAGLRLTSLGVIGILLFSGGYWAGAYDLFDTGPLSVVNLIMQHTPLVAGIGFVALAYWCQSRVIFTLAILLLIPSLFIGFGLTLARPYQSFWLAIATVTIPLLLWGYDDLLLPKVNSRRFQQIARNISILHLISWLYFFSFNSIWRYFSAPDDQTILPINWWMFIDVLFFIGWTIWQWYNLAKPSQRPPHKWGIDQISGIVAGITIIMGIVFYWHWQVNPIPVLATYIMNVLIFILAVGLIRLGLTKGNRGGFWCGLILLTLQILSRTLEYDVELLLKSFVFILCGIGAIAAGLWFEKHLAEIKPQTENSQPEIL